MTTPRRDFHPFFLTFLLSQDEIDFRLASLQKDKRIFFFVFLLPTSAITLVFSSYDAYFSSGNPSDIQLLFVLRTFFLTFNLFVFFSVRPIQDPFHFDRYFLIWLYLACVVSIVVTSMRPATHLLLPLIDFVFLLFLTSLAPNRFAYTLPVLFYGAFSCLSYFLRLEPGFQRTFVTVLFPLTVFLSLANAFFAKRQERDLYRQAANERELRETLERAHHEIRDLREMLPICTHCHSIRDDRGYWQRLDRYFQKNRGIRLSHGLCPSCLVEHYSDDLQSDPILRSAETQALEQKNRADSSNANLPTITPTR